MDLFVHRFNSADAAKCGLEAFGFVEFEIEIINIYYKNILLLLLYKYKKIEIEIKSFV